VIQELATRFVCVADEAFFLGPPSHFKEDWLPDRDSTRLFQSFKGNAPAGVFPNGPTVQGVYCMTAHGDFLSGCFACAARERAKQTIQDGWRRWQQLAESRGYQAQPVPQTPLDHSLGKLDRSRGVRLEAAVRDLPRDDDRKPGRTEAQRCAYNLNWIDLTHEEARSFVTEHPMIQLVPAAILEKVAQKTLKDAVRGQCFDWKKDALKEGRLQTQCVQQQSGRLTMRLTGFVRLEQPGRGYACQLHGKIVYDTVAQRFLVFDLVAAGQRSGKDQFNFRDDDLGPAPLGIAYVLYEPTAP
jgi:hypothetical protein